MWGSSVPSIQGRRVCPVWGWLTVGSTVQPLMFLPLHQDEGEAGAFSIQKCHPQLRWTSSLSYSFTCCPLHPLQLHPGEMAPIHPGPPGCSWPQEGPLPPPKLLGRDLWGGRGQTSGPFPHRAGGW